MHHINQSQTIDNGNERDTALQISEEGQGSEQAERVNAYQARLEAKRERFEERAAAARRESAATLKRARDMASVIPFGQPILIGHHSETRDRNYRDRIHNTYGKGFALESRAEHYEQRAASVGTGGISSDDPQAIAKLRAELAGLERRQEQMKEANKAIRKEKTPEAQAAALVALGYSENDAARMVRPDFAGRIGFPSYSLSNNNANMARIRGRIAELEKLAKRADVEEATEGYTYREDTAENRVMFIFEGKPAAPIRSILKKHAFKWSPSRDAWVRQLTNAGLWAAKCVREKLAALA